MGVNVHACVCTCLLSGDDKCAFSCEVDGWSYWSLSQLWLHTHTLGRQPQYNVCVLEDEAVGQTQPSSLSLSLFSCFSVHHTAVKAVFIYMFSLSLSLHPLPGQKKVHRSRRVE